MGTRPTPPRHAPRRALLLLHGFACTAAMWEPVLGSLRGSSLEARALDLPAHGAHGADLQPVSFERATAAVLAGAPERFALCGYSLGGRVALHVALAEPARLERLVLISTSPGIEDPGERSARLAADQALAERIETEGIEAFAARWAQLPLFIEDPPRVRALARADQLRNTPGGLARALRGLSAGGMAPLWGRLGELAMETEILVGERDHKYRAIGERMAALIPGAALHLLPGGHRLALESPAEVARVLAR